MSEEEIEKEVTALIMSRIAFYSGEYATFCIDAGILTVKVGSRFEYAADRSRLIDDAFVFKRHVSTGLDWVEDKINFAQKALRAAKGGDS